MRILVAWDDRTEADLLGLYLHAGGNQVELTVDRESYLSALRDHPWDVILQSLTLPSVEVGFESFLAAQQEQPGVPIIGACRATEVFALTHFVAHGLRSHMVRDPAGDYVFLLTPTLELACAAASSDEARRRAESLGAEIDSLRRMQQSLLARDAVAPPGYRLAARFEPAQVRLASSLPNVTAGGDFSHILAIDERHCALLVGDAAGHALRAAMTMLVLHTFTRMMTDRSGFDPAAILTRVNRPLCEDQSVVTQDGPITLLCAVLDSATHTLTWAAAGHPVPLMLDAAADTVLPAPSQLPVGPSLGIDADAVFPVQRCILAPGARLLIHSDGLVDAFRETDTGIETFGTSGVCETLHKTAHLPLDLALTSLFDRSYAFTNGAGRHDDTSVVLLERHSETPS
jgi:serine phosphatase RsbU (regulator of sigma subunit)